MSAIFLRRNLAMNFVFLVILALGALRSGDADECPSPYDNGPYTVQNMSRIETIEKSQRSLWIAVPTVEGNVEEKFPVVQFQHGYLIKNTWYSQIINHIASHGFIVVAPQMDVSFFSFDATKETEDASHVLLWILTSLESALSPNFTNIKPDLSKLALVGHSRGGKVVFGMGKKGTIPKVSTIMGLDPVDGNAVGRQTNPHVLTFHESTLNLDVPTLVVGTGLGPKPWLLPFTACAPERVSHEQFFFDLTETVFHFVAKEYGHTDFVDCEGSLVCKCPGIRGSRKPLRDFAGGVVVAFLQAFVSNNNCSFNYILTKKDSAPLIFEVHQKGELPHNHVSFIFTFHLVFGIPLDGLEGSILQEMV